jgi:hypothetical protein
VAVPAAQYALRTQNEKWSTFVATLSPQRAVRMAACRQFFSSWVDSRGHSFYRPTLCQQRDVCPTCAWVYNEEGVASALEVYRLLCGGTGAKIGFGEAEFTLPPSAQRLVGDGMLGAMRRVALTTVNELLSEGGRLVLGSVASTHHWHSSAPLRGWYPHVHLTVLGMAYERDRERFVPIDLYLGERRTANLGQLWREKFTDEFGDVRERRFVAHWHYGKGEATAEHRFRYQFRRPAVETFNAVTKSVELSSVNSDWVMRMLIRPHKEKRHQ